VSDKGIPCTRGTVVCIGVCVGGLGNVRGLGIFQVSGLGSWVCLLVKKIEGRECRVLGGVGVQHAILVSLVPMSHGVRKCSVHPGVHWSCLVE
jgi:hypothetical protein